MNLTLTVQLQPHLNQAASLLATRERVNATAFREHAASQVMLHHLMYWEVCRRFGLSAPMAVRAIGKVAEAYKRDQSIQPVFRPHGALVYDDRLLSWKGGDRVSMLTVQGRTVVPVVMGTYHAPRLRRVRGQADLIYWDGTFYLAVVVEDPEPPPLQPHDRLGVDLGIVNIAADSDGQTYSGGPVNGLRQRHAKLRQRLPKKGTIGEAIAQDTRRGIALEDLTGIRDRITVPKAPRRRQHRWAFAQLRAFITYKAKLAGVAVVLVDPRNTSRTCPPCGLIDQRNRPTQAVFRGIGCGFAGPADTLAAGNIARRAAVNQPDAGSAPQAPASFPLRGEVVDDQSHVDLLRTPGYFYGISVHVRPPLVVFQMRPLVSRRPV
jgi:IS605 OrfB family transposase